MKVILLSHTLDGATLCGQAAAVCTASGNPAKSLRAALASGHESVLEHVSFTFRIEGLSRAALAQLTRHRLASFDVESQRYVKLEDVRMVMPDSIARSEFLQEAEVCLTGSMDLYKRMVAAGIPTEDARYVTPQAVVTNLLVTMNARELRHFFRLRCCNRAQWEIRGVADAMLAFSMTTALVPFWFHNVFGRKSKMFIGDSGTMVMGVLMTWFVVQILRHDTVIWWTEITETCLVAFCLAAMAVPIADTVRVMLGRILKGKDPFSPDKTHLHHIFIKFGMSHAITTATIVGIDIVIALLWYFSYKVLGWSQEMQFYLVVFLGVTLVWGTYSVMRLIEKKNSALKDRLASASLAHPIEGREWWNVVRRWLDAPEVLMERKAMRRERILEERNRRKFVNERGGRKKKKNEKE